MPNLKHRQEKIQEKRKQTDFCDFVKEICSWMPVVLYKNNGLISRFPPTGKEGNIIAVDNYNIGDIVEGKEDKDVFFINLSELFKVQSKMCIQQRFDNENSTYAELYGGKNCYLSFGVGQNVENVAYTACSHTNLRNIFNSFSILTNSDNIFSSRLVTTSYNIFYSSNIHDSHNIWFGSNLIGCSECILCNNLQNKSYCIYNVEYPKKEYLDRKSRILSEKNKFDLYYAELLQLSMDNKVSENVSGQGIVKSQDIENGYFVKRVKYGRNLFIAGGDFLSTHFYDSFDAGNQTDEHLYAVHYVGESSSHVYCVSSGANLHNVYYSYYLESCSYCLGCIGLKNKQFCILNKQYSKEERHKKVDEIFKKMDEDGILGDFFPGSMNPFYFNDTAAYLIDDSFTKEEVEKEGYLWRDEAIKVDVPEGLEVVETKDLGEYEGWITPPSSASLQTPPLSEGSDPSSEEAFVHPRGDVDEVGKGVVKQRHIDPTILKKVIKDKKGNYYRIVKMEYDFLMKHGLPLPRLHRLDRIKLGFKFK